MDEYIADAITTDQTSKLLNKPHLMMKHIPEGGEGIIRHDMSSNGAIRPSPVERILATCESGQVRVCKLKDSTSLVHENWEILRSLIHTSAASLV